MALLHLARDWAAARGVDVAVATVDHGLRREAADEAAMVADACAALGLSHDTLRWSGWDRQGNLQDKARQARYRLLAEWARARKVAAVALGHTQDDQAETFLMRLARGSGVDGLAAMRRDWTAQGTRWLRPMLALSRQDLRDYLREKGVVWVDDPGNDDPAYDRIKARHALVALAPLGLDAARLAETATAMTRARAALNAQTYAAAENLCQTQFGDVLISAAAQDLPAEIHSRLFAHALQWVASAPYRPRLSALQQAWRDVGAGTTRTLHGCHISAGPDHVRISREYQAVKDVRAELGALWDNRWRLTGPATSAEVRALGEAVKDCPDWRAGDLPRAALMASPAVFDGETLLAAPLAGFGPNWSAKLEPNQGDFAASVLSH
ncbi:MAG TPA: tRNA lysidine(34) synthetase TilS [Aliiroseovarius sp.]|nr:tRNA lysidine(34) synthetase TilS [Aliiroseovarius sp.]